MNTRRVGTLFVGAGLLMALVAGMLVYSQLRSAERRAEQVPSKRVVVATQDIPEQGRIALSVVDTVSISDEVLPARPFTNPEQAIGKYARQRIYRGDILTEDRVVSLEQIRRDLAAGSPAPSPSLVLDKDQVMLVFPSRMAGNFAGQGPNLLTATDALRPGDYVDILLTTLELPDSMPPEQRELARRERPWDYLQTRVVFQNLRVHQVGAFTGLDQNQIVSTRSEERYVTFVVDRETALRLKWLKDIVALGQGNVDFVLRSPLHQEVEPAQPLTVQEIRRELGVYSGRQ